MWELYQMEFLKVIFRRWVSFKEEYLTVKFLVLVKVLDKWKHHRVLVKVLDKWKHHSVLVKVLDKWKHHSVSVKVLDKWQHHKVLV